MKCATCGAELIEVGYPTDFSQHYRCPNGCEDILPWWTKIVDTIYFVLFIVVMTIFALFVLIGGVFVGKKTNSQSG